MDNSLYDDLYFGEYNPGDALYGMPEYHKIMDQLTSLENKLEKQISKNDYDMVEKITDAYNQLNDLYAKEYYKVGIKFALKFVFNAFFDNPSN